MAPLRVDVVVLGSGFGGSLMALLLQRIGLRAVLIDRGHHPRFAIGESSTPVADLVLADLSREYDLPRLAPLSKYGSWRAAYPNLKCGIKRGFSYFHHQPHRPFHPTPTHDNEMLVAASSSDQLSDTHWYRADVDAFFAAEVRRETIPFFEDVTYTISPNDAGWQLTGHHPNGPLNVVARFAIDATGEAGVVPRTLGISRDPKTCLTHSRAIFSHFDNLRPWKDLLPAGSDTDYPFPCDHAALHQLIEEGWMWQLRFDNGLVSAGFAIDDAAHPLNSDLPIEQEWNDLLNRYPSIAAQFDSASFAEQPGSLKRTGRMQRLATQIAGPNWALLPNTAGFIDPLHSSGIAQTLCGVERLILALKHHWHQPSLPQALAHYERSLQQEFSLVDHLVAGGYASRRCFPLFAAFSMLYFAAATTYERRRQRRESPPGSAFLCADDSRLRNIITHAFHRLRETLSVGNTDYRTISAFEHDLAREIAPYNHAGLFDPAAQNMYRYTALPEA